MRLFITYRDERYQYDAKDQAAVRDIKETIREVFGIGPDEGPAGVDLQEKKLLTLTYAGSDLDDTWTVTDIGLLTGCTLKAVLRDQIKPTLFIHTMFNNKVLPLFDKINFHHTSVMQFRGMVSRKTGLPVGVFRMVSCVKNTEESDNAEGLHSGPIEGDVEGSLPATPQSAPRGKKTPLVPLEMFDCHMLSDYGLGLNSTVKVETWDGWSELLKLCLHGFTTQVMESLSQDEVIARYQMKVALYVAAHFGHVDLAVTLLRSGMRADEPVGDHPMRQWCQASLRHIDSMKAPVHEATEAGQLGVLRSFVHNNVCNVLAKDGNGLTPLNISLRCRQKPCASFLLTKHWSKVNYTKRVQMPLSIYVKMKRWSDRAKDKVLMLHGQWKSSIRNPRRHAQTDALVGYGVQLDGFNGSRMTSKSDNDLRVEMEAEHRRRRGQGQQEAPEAEVYFKAINFGPVRLPRITRWNRALSKASQDKMRVTEAVQEAEAEMSAAAAAAAAAEESESVTGSGGDASGDRDRYRRGVEPRPRSSSVGEPARPKLKLPPIHEKMAKTKNISSSYQDLTTPAQPEAKQKNKALFLRTGASPGRTKSQRSMSEVTNSKDSPSPEVSKKMMKRPRRHRRLSCDAQSSPRPFVAGSQDATQDTLDVYEKHRGLTSRDYASRCLAVANTFCDRPWLAQIQQAMNIAAQGVRRVAAKEPHLFIRDSVGEDMPTSSRDSCATV